MKTIFSFLFCACIASASFARGFDASTIILTGNIVYKYTVDLRELHNDQVKVELDFKAPFSLPTPESMIFCLPKIVPGIYGAMDFGQNLTSIEASDLDGKALQVERLDINRWKIAGVPSRLVYFINDGWEEFNEHKTGAFLSAESSFQENKAFVINHNTLFGYFEGVDKKRIQLKILKPQGFYGATSLSKPMSKDTEDHYIADDYHQLVDNPILYAMPDTTRFMVGGSEITVAMFSTTGKKLSKEIAAYIQPLLEKQKVYLGGELPVKHYTFMLYHNENPQKNSAMGDGLEHSNSTLILMYMPLDVEMIKWNVYGIASHEFFHTLLPLGLHSNEIEFYNFNQPKLSRHIWLYEGTTEYFTLHMPVVQKAETIDEFLQKLERKMIQMQEFKNEKSLTFLSENAIENQDDYYNFYLKGALLNVCLDIQLREWSKGKYGVLDLVKDLMEVYGKDKPFKDDMLFDEMARVSGYPQLRTFFSEYVEGTKLLPLEAAFLKVGIACDMQNNTLKLVEKPSRAQLKLRKAWIKHE